MFCSYPIGGRYLSSTRLDKMHFSDPSGEGIGDDGPLPTAHLPPVNPRLPPLSAPPWNHFHPQQRDAIPPKVLTTISPLRLSQKRTRPPHILQNQRNTSLAGNPPARLHDRQVRIRIGRLSRPLAIQSAELLAGRRRHDHPCAPEPPAVQGSHVLNDQVSRIGQGLHVEADHLIAGVKEPPGPPSQAATEVDNERSQAFPPSCRYRVMKPWLLEITLSLLLLAVGGVIVAGVYSVAAEPHQAGPLTHPLGCPPDRPHTTLPL
jgi:hypothetical protein